MKKVRFILPVMLVVIVFFLYGERRVSSSVSKFKGFAQSTRKQCSR